MKIILLRIKKWKRNVNIPAQEKEPVAARLEKRQPDFEWIPNIESLKEKAAKGKKRRR